GGGSGRSFSSTGISATEISAMSAVAAPCCAVFGVLGVPSTVSRDSICATCKGGLLKSPSFRNEEGERLKADLAAIIRSHAFVRGADYRNLPRPPGDIHAPANS